MKTQAKKEMRKAKRSSHARKTRAASTARKTRRKAEADPRVVKNDRRTGVVLQQDT